MGQEMVRDEGEVVCEEDIANHVSLCLASRAGSRMPSVDWTARQPGTSDGTAPVKDAIMFLHRTIGVIVAPFKF